MLCANYYHIVFLPMPSTLSRHKNFFHAHKISSEDSKIPLVIDAEDTDLIVLAAFTSYGIASPLLLYKKVKIYDCRKLCSPGMSSILLQLHVYTGAD